METYAHTEQPLGQLQERSKELSELLKIQHGEERLQQIQHEISCIALETWCRQNGG